MLRIGSIALENSLVMAPMAGITSLPFRRMIKKLGAGLVTTEMISAEGITRRSERSLNFLKTHPSERPLAVQIFGSNRQVMARAAQMVVEAGADIVDINMGCPVKKVAKTGSGAALMKDARKVAGIVSAVRLACPVPLTIKVRAGWSPAEPTVCEIARIIEDCGADAITVHPRFATDGYAVPADWEWIGRVKEQLTIPVIGNGDVTKPSQALDLKQRTGCDGVMLGRGAVGNPWLFTQVMQLEQGLPISEPTLSDRRDLILQHFHGLCETMGEHRASLVMRGLLLRYTKGLPHSSDFRGSISRINDMETLVSAMDTYFSSLQDIMS